MALSKLSLICNTLIQDLFLLFEFSEINAVSREIPLVYLSSDQFKNICTQSERIHIKKMVSMGKKGISKNMNLVVYFHHCGVGGRSSD